MRCLQGAFLRGRASFDLWAKCDADKLDVSRRDVSKCDVNALVRLVFPQQEFRLRKGETCVLGIRLTARCALQAQRMLQARCALQAQRMPQVRRA